MKCNGRTCKNEALPGLKVCAKCREWRKGYYSTRRAEPKDPSLCRRTDCQNKADPGFKSCSRCRSRTKAYEDLHRVDVRRRSNEFYYRLKDEVFSAYGGYKCSCCGEVHKEFLSIDHINGDGPEHRERLTGSPRNGQTLYYWLKRNGFPVGFRVLCMNCNFSLGHHGFCPHHPEVRQPCNIGRKKTTVPTTPSVV